MAHGLLPAEAGRGSVAQEAEAATAEAIPGAPIQAGPPYLYAYYYMSALAEMDPENTITHLITLIDSQDYQDIENFGDESSIAELQSLLTQKHQLLHGAFDSQKRTMAQLENAISCMLAEQAWMASMQAQLQAFSVKVGSALAQMQKEEEALAEEQRLQKQAKAGEIVEMMKENGFSVDDLNQALSMNTEKMNVAEPSVAAEPSMSVEPAEKKTSEWQRLINHLS